MAKCVIFLENGFEETEALAVVDILRRGNIDITIAGVESLVTGSHNITIKSDKLIKDINHNDYDAFILPGGMPGATNLINNEFVIKNLQSAYNDNKLICAICASPMVLDHAGILKGKSYTIYPNMEDRAPSGNYINKPVVIDSNIITACGPAIVFDFALTILKTLKDESIADNVAKAMLLK